MKNTLSEFAREVMIAGLEKQPIISVGDVFEGSVAGNIYNVPEKPDDFDPNFVKSTTSEIAVLVTGGLDSTALYFMAKKSGKSVRAFYMDIGQPYASKEIDSLMEMEISFEVVRPDVRLDVSKFWKHIIPGRNFYFLCLAAEMIRGGEIWFGATNGEMPLKGGDKSLAFIKHCNQMFSRLPYPVRVVTPLSDMTKGEIIAWWKENVPLENLYRTISCFNSDEGACGECQACLRKALAFVTNDLTSPYTKVDVRVGCREYITKYLVVLTAALKNKDFSHYSKKRAKEDLLAIERLLGRT